MGGLDKQIQELVEAVVLPVTHADRFKSLGIRPPKGVLLYGPPGTGKTLIARACAAQTNATFLKLAGGHPRHPVLLLAMFASTSRKSGSMSKMSALRTIGQHTSSQQPCVEAYSGCAYAICPHESAKSAELAV